MICIKTLLSTAKSVQDGRLLRLTTLLKLVLVCDIENVSGLRMFSVIFSIVNLGKIPLVRNISVCQCKCKNTTQWPRPGQGLNSCLLMWSTVGTLQENHEAKQPVTIVWRILATENEDSSLYVPVNRLDMSFDQHFARDNSMSGGHAHGHTLGMRGAVHWPHCCQAAANKSKHAQVKILNNKFLGNRDAAQKFNFIISFHASTI